MGDDTVKVLSILDPKQVIEREGLPREAVAGTLEGSDEAGLAPDQFTPNPDFIEFMHRVIKKHGPVDPGVRALAEGTNEGWVYIVDMRTPTPEGPVPAEDIIGAFEVKGGQLDAESYQPGEKHQIYTENGLVTLPATLHAVWIKELMAID